jgi:hypothetical protein
MHLIYQTHSGFQALAPLLSWIIVVGGFLGCVLFLWAWGTRRELRVLHERIRQLELAAHTHGVPNP